MWIKHRSHPSTDLEDLDLDSPVHQQPRHHRLSRLTDSVDPGDSLLLYRGVQARLEQEHMVGPHKCEAGGLSVCVCVCVCTSGGVSACMRVSASGGEWGMGR